MLLLYNFLRNLNGKILLSKTVITVAGGQRNPKLTHGTLKVEHLLSPIDITTLVMTVLSSFLETNTEFAQDISLEPRIPIYNFVDCKRLTV